MLQVFNERRFVGGCIEHLHEQGIGVYLIDNESTDETLAIAERYVGRGVVGIETLPRGEEGFALRAQCERQEQLAQTLDADWLIHHDADEIRVSPRRGQTLAQAIEQADADGYNAVNFLEFTFVPTRESPDHDHPDFQRTMLWYYPFLPTFPHRLNAWKRQDGPVELGTHRVQFPGLKMAPESLYMKHYLYLSRAQALEKFVQRDYSPQEVAGGLHGWRARLRAEQIELPSESELRRYVSDEELDPSEPRTRHLLEELMSAPEGQPEPAQRRGWRRLRRSVTR
jgi:glycosyltransferase involved in cell wall biosynthesis